MERELLPPDHPQSPKAKVSPRQPFSSPLHSAWLQTLCSDLFTFLPHLPRPWASTDASALGLAPDFVVVNPIGFLCLTIWSFGAYFSTTARRQYADCHDGHLPQVSKSDLAFSAHALLLSLLTLAQSSWLFWRAHQRRKNPTPNEDSTLILRRKDAEFAHAPVAPLKATRFALVFMAIASLYVATSTIIGHTQLLDFLYFASSLKIGEYKEGEGWAQQAVITAIKYTPQLLLNYQLKSVRGFAILAILCVRSLNVLIAQLT